MASQEYPKGKVLCLIINEKHFDVVKEKEIFKFRQGADEDEAALLKALTPFNVEIRKEKDLTSTGIKDYINQTANEVSSCDCMYAGLLVFVMSHGGQDNEGRDYIVGKDNNKVFIMEVIQPFHNEYCIGMSGKPKCFLFNCCRGAGTNAEFDISILEHRQVFSDQDQTLNRSNNQIPVVGFKRADYMIVHSTVGGFAANRNATEGSAFIQTFCDTIQRDTNVDGARHFADLIQQTKFRLSDEGHGSMSCLQIPEVTDTLCYHFALELKGML